MRVGMPHAAWLGFTCKRPRCTSMVLETKAGLLCCKLDGDSKVTVDMGKPEARVEDKFHLAKEMRYGIT